MVQTAAPNLRPLPIYATYLTFERAMDQFRRSGLPSVVAAETISAVPPDTARRLVAGFRAVGWIDNAGAPSADFQAMARTRGTSDWQQALGNALRHAYPFLPREWESLTSTQLAAAFQKHTGRDDKALKSAQTFFIAAALDAGIALTAELTIRASKTREDMSVRFRRDVGETSAAKPKEHAGRRNGATPHAEADVAQVWDLLALVDDAEMTDKEKSAALTFFAYLRRRADRNRGPRA